MVCQVLRALSDSKFELHRLLPRVLKAQVLEVYKLGVWTPKGQTCNFVWFGRGEGWSPILQFHSRQLCFSDLAF